MIKINKIYLMDCMDLMKQMPDNFIDLAICDPPYGIGADSKNSRRELKSKKSATLSKDYGSQVWDNNIPTEDYFKELMRVSKNQIIWGANYYGLKGGMIYWHKNVTMPTYSDGEIAYCSLINSIKFFSYTWHGMLQQDMKNKEIRIHPTQKPVGLYKWLLTNYAKKGDLIFDSHLGSMSSIIACIQYEFDYIGCEIDKEYYEQGEKRIEIEKMQLKLY